VSVILKTADFHTKRFSWDCVRRTLVAEASTLGYKGPRRIYDDAADVGIALLSEMGNTVRFYLSKRDVCGEDVAGWRFEPIAEDVRKHPRLKGLSVLIIND
jgi:hypothetical protein